MAKVITAFITLIILLSIDYPVFKSIINTINPKKHLKMHLKNETNYLIQIHL